MQCDPGLMGVRRMSGKTCRMRVRWLVILCGVVEGGACTRDRLHDCLVRVAPWRNRHSLDARAPALFCPQIVMSAVVGLCAGNVLLCSLPEDPRRLFAKVGECAPAPETCVRMALQFSEACVPALGGMHGWHLLRWHLLLLQDILLYGVGLGLSWARNWAPLAM